MPKNDQTASIDQSVDLTYAAISYVPKFYILAYADRSGNKQLDVDYGNEDPDHLPPTLSAFLNGHPAMAIYNGVVYLTHQTSGTDHSLWYMTFDGTNWSGDTQVPNVSLNESPGMAVFDGNLYVAHQGSDTTGTANTLWYTVTNGRGWSQDKNISGIQLNGSPAMVVFANTLHLFFRGIDGSTLWYTSTSDGKSWSPKSQVPGVSMANSPSAAVREGLLYVAYHNRDDASICYVTCDERDPSYWSSPSTVGGQASERPIADGSSPALYLDTITNHLMVAYPDASGFDVECSVAPSESVPSSMDPTVASVIYNSNLIQAYADCTGNQVLNVVYGDKQTTQTLPASLNGYPAMAVFDGLVHLTHKTSIGYSLWHMTYDGTNWSTNTLIPNVYLNESPGMAVFNGNLYLAHQGSDITSSANTLWYTVFDGKTWSQDTNISGVELNGSPAMAVFNNVLYLFFQGTDGSSLWYTTTSDGKSWSPQLQVPGVSMRNSPSAAVRDDTLYVAYHSKDAPSIWYLTYDADNEWNWSQPTFVRGPTTDLDHISDRCSPTLYEDNAGNLMVTYTSAQAYDLIVSVVPPEG
ncbi:hypothetical protein [Pandoraea pulmonicola]|uniref:Uncharacterized protein n=1 Tax=Pandoraea pulmonicola TaxID=93221 RepID=A0AAJ4Z896_PANPU|nr:hypothetical protein [Pandoraea pulmonicola]APD13467.1 hypothetical protein RO07_25385 [Pandoraea pulmonicola]SUA88615.1 Uncharacterised protein [Pandoraea pulmonicola]